MQQLFETEHLNKLKEYIYSDKKIDGIKLIRQVTGLGLKESKDLFESLYHNKSKLDEYISMTETFEDSDKVEYQEPALNEKDIRFVKIMLKEGQKLNAVKYVKEKLQTGLKEAKEIVDSLEEGESETETIIFGEDDSLMVESDLENEQSIIFETVEEDPEIEVEPTENLITKKVEKRKKKRTPEKESQPFTFEKILKRDKDKKRTRSNSGCMLTLTFMFFTALLIFTGIYFL